MDHHHHCHDEHDHDHDHVPPPDTNASQSLYQHIVHDEIVTLNEKESDMGKSVFKPWDRRLDSTEYLESDVDEQLLITVPFTGVVKLHSILIRSVADQSAPATIKLYKNRDDIDFSTASDLHELAKFQHPEGIGGTEGQVSEEAPVSADLDAEGIVQYAVNRSHFSNITSLTLFIESNHGHDTTKILYIGFRGEWLNMNRNAPVVTIYEAAANPRDHKNPPVSDQSIEEA